MFIIYKHVWGLTTVTKPSASKRNNLLYKKMTINVRRNNFILYSSSSFFGFNFILFFQVIYLWWPNLFPHVWYFQMAIYDLPGSRDRIWYFCSLDMENDSQHMYYLGNHKCQIRLLDTGLWRRTLWWACAALAGFPQNFVFSAVHEQIFRDWNPTISIQRSIDKRDEDLADGVCSFLARSAKNEHEKTN